MKIIKIPIDKQPTRAKALEVAHTVLERTCREFSIAGTLVYYNDKVQLHGTVPLEVTLNYQTVTTHDFHRGDVVEVVETDNGNRKRYGKIFEMEHVTQALSVQFPGGAYGTFLLADTLVTVIGHDEPMTNGKGRW